jgi:lysine-N-methylase
MIEVTDEERQRILGQGWSPTDGIPEQQAVIVRTGRFSRGHRLAHRDDGACVFLDENGLCRIHAKFGEAAKPLACRIYPYTFHPAGRQVAVGLRFSCPSVVENLGASVSSQSGQLRQIAAQVVPQGIEDDPAPEITPGQRLDWKDFKRFQTALQDGLSEGDLPLAVRLRRILFWLDLVKQSRFEEVRGRRLDEFLALIRQAADIEDAAECEPPSRTGGVMFRLLVAQYARKDTLLDLESGLSNRLRLFVSALKFARGRGQIPVLQDGFGPATFDQLEQPFGVPAEAQEILTRYFQVKVQSIHFCGRACYGLPLVEGFWSLALIYPSILWLARWLAVTAGRQALTTADLQQAIAVADHHHGFSPAFGQAAFRMRTRELNRRREIRRLVDWYSR